MIVWVASYPRSGNSYCLNLLNRGCSIAKRKVYDVGESERARFISALVESNELFALKTHELPGDDDWPAIYLVRDGRDSLVSYSHYILSTERGIQVGADLKAFQEELGALIRYEETLHGGYGGWSRNVLSWLRRTAPTTIVRFEDLVREPAQTIEKAWQTATGQEVKLDKSAVPTFQELHEKVPWYFRRGEVGAWRTEMPAELHELFWQSHGAAMRALRYVDGRPSRLSRFVQRLAGRRRS